MYQIKHLFLLATLAIGTVTGLPSPDVLGSRESCLKEHNLCAQSSDTITSFTLCNQKFIVCLESLLSLNKVKKVSPDLTIQIPTSPRISMDGGLDGSDASIYCPQPSDAGVDENCTITCEPGVQYYPHPTDCGRFCQCSNGYPVNQPCPAGLEWNQDLQVCDYPSAVNCQPLPECLNPSSTATSSIDVALDDSTSKYHPQSDDEDCEVTCEVDVEYYPNPADCNSFYQCSDGHPYLQQCPSNLHWDEARDTCNLPEVADCQLLPECQNPPSSSTSHSKTDGEL